MYYTSLYKEGTIYLCLYSKKHILECISFEALAATELNEIFSGRQ